MLDTTSLYLQRRKQKTLAKKICFQEIITDGLFLFIHLFIYSLNHAILLLFPLKYHQQNLFCHNYNYCKHVYCRHVCRSFKGSVLFPHAGAHTCTKAFKNVISFNCLSVCPDHVTYVFYSCVNVKELLAQNRCNI